MYEVLENGRPVVALLAEGVDRNTLNLPGLALYNVALLAEGVDRNEAALS